MRKCCKFNFYRLFIADKQTTICCLFVCFLLVCGYEKVDQKNIANFTERKLFLSAPIEFINESYQKSKSETSEYLNPY